MRYLTLLFFLGVVLVGQAQTRTIVITGTTMDELGDTIGGVKVSVVGAPSKFVYSRSNGSYSLPFTYDPSKTNDILFHSVFYQDRSIRIDKRKLRRVLNDTLFNQHVKLSYVQTLLEGPVVRPDNPPTEVFSSDSISVSDFEFFNHQLILLTYEKNIRKGTEILLTDYSQNVIDRHEVPGIAVRLFKDYTGRIYVITEKEVYKIGVRNNKLGLSKVVREEFYGITQRILDSLGEYYYYSDYNEYYPAFHYYAQQFGDTTAKVVHNIEDKFIMELYRSEYKYVDGQEKLWALRREQATGIDKEIWIGAKYFTNNLYYEAPYAPLFVKEDSVFIFDHYEGMLYKLDRTTEKTDSVPIVYHRLTRPHEWEQPLIADASTQEIFALFMRAGHYYIKQINTDDGTTSPAFKFYFKFVEQVKIKEDYVYYIYRPYESYQKKFLYKEKIKLKLE